VLFAYEIPDFFFALLEVYNMCRGFVKMCDDCVRHYEGICKSVLNVKNWFTFDVFWTVHHCDN